MGAAILKALWRGEIGLAKTFWLYGVAGSLLLILLVLVLEATNPWFLYEGFEEPGLGLQLLYVVATRGYYLWSFFIYIAIWRSASNYEGLRDWAFVAKILVSLSLFGLLLFLAIETAVVTF